nr:MULTISPECIES: hypothetical protein [Providencia]
MNPSRIARLYFWFVRMINPHVSCDSDCYLGSGVGATSETRSSCYSTRSNFWEHVAFYNYIQSIVEESGRIRPTNEMWEEAEKPFLVVVESLKPDVVIVLGSMLGEWVPALNDNVKVAYLYHPSSGYFNYEGVIPAIKKAMNDAKRESNS